jgi:CheY-like chemotaxis protein
LRFAIGGDLRILLVEDDIETAGYVLQGLKEAGHSVEIAANGRSGLFRAAGEEWDLLIVDRMLPGLDGVALVRTLRGAGIETPVLFLTTLGGIDDRVEGLDAGADDYLVKPFAFSELAARVAALGRRPRRAAQETRDRSSTARIPAARISHAPRQSGRDPHDVAGESLGFEFRSPHQRRRKPHQPPAPEDRSGPRVRTDPYGSRSGLLPAGRSLACQLGASNYREFFGRRAFG